MTAHETGDQATARAAEPTRDPAGAPSDGPADDPAEERPAEERPAEEHSAEPAAGPPLLRRAAALPRTVAIRAGRLPVRWRITSMAVLSALVLAAAVSAALLGAAAHHDDAVASARNAARAAATAEIPQILSYDYRSISADLARARSDTTGQFRQQFGSLASEIIAPAAKRQQTVTRAAVPSASVLSATADQVVVLVFIDQSTTNKAQRQPQNVTSQIKVTMRQAGSRWLVEQFQAL